MRNFCMLAVCLTILASGCAQGHRMTAKEEREANNRLLRENESRLNSLEDSVNSLNTQLAQLNNRVYEVRTSNGRKTTMRVVPVGEGEPAAIEPAGRVVEPKAAPAAKKATPHAKKIDPGAKPSPMPSRQAQAKAANQANTAASRGSIGRPEASAGPSGQISPQNVDLALPPADIPATPAEASPAATISAPPEADNPRIPVPLVPTSDLALPPEAPVAAPAAPSQAPATAQTSQAPAAAKPPLATTPARGEDAAYKAALNAARSGRTAEGVRLFENFLRQYPNSRYTANADYWIGECLYAQGKYRDALSRFQTVNNSFPGHHKNADALLKAAMTLNRLGDRQGAAEKYRVLMSSFPNSDAARRARAMGMGR